MAALPEIDVRKPALPNAVLHRLQAALDHKRVLEATSDSRAHEIFDATEVEDCSVDRVHFGSGLGYVVDYTLQVRSAGATNSIKAFGQVPFGDPVGTFQAAKSKLQGHHEATGVGHPPAIALLDSMDVILRAAGADERIEALPTLLTSPSRELSSTLPRGGELFQQWSDVELLSHRLGKRAVLRLSGTRHARGEPTTAILKLYKRKSTAAAHCASICAALERQASAGGTPVAIPRIFHLFDRAPGILMEEVAGLPLHLADRSAQIAGHRSAGQVLGRFHSCKIPGLQPYGVADEIDLLRRWLAFVASVRPSLAAGLTHRVAHLAREAARCVTYTPAPIHRDFHDKQVIVDQDRCTLIDFDTVRSGDPAQDIGNFLAHIQLRALQVPDQSGLSKDWGAFIDGYRSTACKPADFNIDWHRRATLVRLALICSFSDTWSHLVEDLESCA